MDGENEKMAKDRLSFAVAFYGPAVWLLIALMTLMGLVGLIAPELFRAGLEGLGSPRVAHVAGAITVVAGAILFLRPYRANAVRLRFPRVVFWLGVLTALKGLLWLLFPELLQKLLPHYTAQSAGVLRVLGVLCLSFAAAFYFLLTSVRSADESAV